jgi:virulence-associated protein VagC
MKKISLILNNKIQSMIIPKEDQFSGDKVLFEKFGDIGIVIDTKSPWAAFELAQILANGEFMREGREVFNF